ncbi:hypothetical protein EA860_14325 [Vibrio anguillarum]|nr:hypothetical protein [Vibrio anguillarum]
MPQDYHIAEPHLFGGAFVFLTFVILYCALMALFFVPVISHLAQQFCGAFHFKSSKQKDTPAGGGYAYE